MTTAGPGTHRSRRRHDLFPAGKGDLDGDGDPDVVRVGTSGGGVVTDISDVDGDGDDEVTVSDPTLGPGQTDGASIDGPQDTDADVRWVGR